VANPLIKIDGALDEEVQRVVGVAKSEVWLDELRRASGKLNASCDFPESTIRRCAKIEDALSDDPAAMLSYYVWLGSGCLTTAFIMTQRNAALRRIETSRNETVRIRALQSIRSGDSFATVGISHLTTSRRHLRLPPLRAVRSSEGWILDGFCPWVTGGQFADWLVVGALEIDKADHVSATSKPNEFGRNIGRSVRGAHGAQREFDRPNSVQWGSSK
jgi:hypothetical protein